jgi:hypothetical protein
MTESEAPTQIIGKAEDLRGMASTSRIEVAHKVHAQAIARIAELDVQIRAAFKELEKAQGLLKEIGVEAVTKFSKPVDSAWASWRNEQR